MFVCVCLYECVAVGGSRGVCVCVCVCVCLYECVALGGSRGVCVCMFVPV